MGFSLRACGWWLAASLALSPSYARAQSAVAPRGTVRGRILDSQSAEPVGQAEVNLGPTGPRTHTDDEGRFVLMNVPAKLCTLRVLRVGYAPLRHELNVAEGAETAVELRLIRTAVPLEAITVTPGAFSFMGQASGTRQTLTRDDVQAVPQIGDDIFRAVNRLPGLVSNDYAAHFGIRGGRHD